MSTVASPPILDVPIEKIGSSTANLTDAELVAWDAFNLERIDLNLVGGDVLVVVRFDEDPTSFPVNCNGVSWRTKVFSMQSHKLNDTGSSIFRKLLAPEKQTAERQKMVLKKVGMKLESLPDGIKSVIDLTPSEEGDEVAANLAQMSLPAGVIMWWRSKTRLGVSKWIVSGHDDKCPDHDRVTDDEDLISWPREISDYCPIRHRVAILRLMMLIDNPQHYRLLMNSAARAYTMTAIAKIYDCIDLVRDTVYAWLLTPQNDAFVDFNPEIALEMAWILRIPSVTQSAMRIIVAENALEAVASETATQSRCTKFGRQREHLQDDLRNIIQYATRALVTRVHNTCDNLKGDIFDWLQISEWYRLLEIGGVIEAESNVFPDRLSTFEEVLVSKARTSFKEVRSELGNFINKLVLSAFNSPSSFHESVDISRKFYLGSGVFRTTDDIINGLSQSQQILTRQFWEKLTDRTLDIDILLSHNIGFSNLNEDLDKVVEFFPALQNWSYGCFFDEHIFHEQLLAAIKTQHGKWTGEDRELDLSHTHHLALGLTLAEFKFLPKWAGGEDDGTGKVFEDTDLPDAELGPAGPGPVYHTADTEATETSTIAPSAPTESVSDLLSVTRGFSIAPAATDETATADHDPDFSLVDFSLADESELDVSSVKE